MNIYLYSLLYSTVSNTFTVYKAFNFRKIKNLFMVSARFCEMYFILQVLMYTLQFMQCEGLEATIQTCDITIKTKENE